jgi:endo-1,4-beta-D-glucanase Y
MIPLRTCSNLPTVFRRVAVFFLLAWVLQIGTACAAPPNWDDFKTRFIQPEGRVVDTGNNNVSHSEGQGYAMVMAVAYDDRATFDRVWQWTDKTLSRKDMRLFSWRYEPGPGPSPGQVTDPNNATDGDLLIAWALQRAGARWSQPQYAQASADIRQAILSKLAIRAGGRTLLAPGLTGFVEPDSVMVNPSYAVMPALDAFAALEPKSPWPLIRNESLRMLRDARFGDDNLPTDWARVDQNGVLWSEPTKPPQFGFDAVRVPLYLCWSGRCSDKALDGVRRWWTRTTAGDMKPPAWVDVRTGETAPFPASAGVESIARLTLTGKLGALPPGGDDYYASALLILSEIASREGKARR